MSQIIEKLKDPFRKKVLISLIAFNVLLMNFFLTIAVLTFSFCLAVILFTQQQGAPPVQGGPPVGPYHTGPGLPGEIPHPE
jgi:hypothetical protein